MRLSLRAQLGMAIVLVTLAVVALVLASSRRQLVEEFARLEGGSDTTFVSDAAAKLQAWYPHAQGFAWRGADSVLATVAHPRSVQLVLQSSAGVVVAATRPDLRAARLEGGGAPYEQAGNDRGVLRLTDRAGRSPVVLTFAPQPGARVRLLFDAPPSRALHGADGRVTGVVYSFYMPGGGGLPPRDRTSGAVNRVVLVPILAGALVSIVLLFFAATRMLSPLGALTQATRRLAKGDRSARVPVAGAAEVAELASAFNGMAAALDAAEAARRQMVSDVAHELRTPLTNLRCRLEAMQDGLAPSDAEGLRALHDETLLLSRLVEDLQLLSLADSGRLPLERASEDLRELAARAVAAMAPRAEAAGVEMRLAPGPPVPANVDAGRVGQVLRNLLTNALEHTPRGGRVTVRTKSGPSGALLEVCDDGVGLAPEHLPHVFDRFWRADPSRARGEAAGRAAAGSGAGLGLAIVRQLVQLHGGDVSVTSAPGAGACFRVRLPAAAGFTASS